MDRRFKQVYQFKITLKEIRPPIWRRIQVPKSYTFWDLHVAVQDAMGWLDLHLHAFFVQNPKTSTSEQIGIPEDDLGWSERPVIPGWERKISEYFSLKNSEALYVYDFGDDWGHDVKLEKILPRERGVDYPLCVQGNRACPPEDCGGVPGYQDLREILSDPKHEDYEETVEWLGEGFDPEYFKPEEIEFWDPEERWEMAFDGAEERDDDAFTQKEDSEPDDTPGWLSNDYYLEILELAKVGDLDHLGPDERRLAKIMLDHGEEFFKDVDFADDYPVGEDSDDSEIDPFFHITVHAIVEDQLEDKDPREVYKFYDAMIKKQTGHHEVVHLIAAILVPLLFKSLAEQKPFATESYKALLIKYKNTDPSHLLDLLEHEPELFIPEE